MDAAFAHAEKSGRRLPGAISNNFSLAEMVNPVWPGVLAASDEAWKAWLRQRGIPIFAWSSQARGFFTDRAAPDRLSDKELVNAWYSEKNFARPARPAPRQAAGAGGARLLPGPGLPRRADHRAAGSKRARGFAAGPRHHPVA